MLSKALDRANEAVHLDNVQDHANARRVYQEACELLESVMGRTSNEQDKGKLISIVSELIMLLTILTLDETLTYEQRETYLARITELGQIIEQDDQIPGEDEFGPSDGGDGSGEHTFNSHDRPASREQRSDESRDEQEGIPTEHGTWESSSMSNDLQKGLGLSIDPFASQSMRSGSDNNTLSPPNQGYLPPPLSPRRSPAPDERDDATPKPNVHQIDSQHHQRESGVKYVHHFRDMSSSSWNSGPTKEEVSMSSSPNHSISSFGGVRKRDLKHDTEAEFDAALDAAVEAAYDEGYEPYEAIDVSPYKPGRTSLRNQDPIAKEAQFFQDREAQIQAAQNRVSLRKKTHDVYNLAEELSEDESGLETDEEDRLLAEGVTETKDDEDSFPPLESRVPRTSDSSGFSSGFSGRTYGSSVASSLNTAGTSLSTVDENASMPNLHPKLQSIQSPPPVPPLTAPLPPIPPSSTAKPGNLNLKQSPSSAEHKLLGLPSPIEKEWQERRLSASKSKDLKIETGFDSPEKRAGEFHGAKQGFNDSDDIQPPKTAYGVLESGANVSPDDKSSTQTATATLSGSSEAFSTQPLQPSGAMSPSTPTMSNASPQSHSPARAFQRAERPHLQKSMSSLNTKKSGLSGIGEGPDTSPGSPMSTSFGSAFSPPDRTGSFAPGTPLGTSFGQIPAAPGKHAKIFHNHIHSSSTPGVPNMEVPDGPLALEPCPESILLRPFWLMRCINQTLTNPRGGYISTRLFVPREVWEVKNVKLKNVEEKIATCDTLTAALDKLSAVDTLDAEAVCEELQSFDSVLDGVQANLSKKLGSEVGVKDAGFFRDAPATSSNSNDPTVQTPSSEAGNTLSGGNTPSSANPAKPGSRSYLSSWKKLRSKNSSSTNLASGGVNVKEPNKDKNFSMPTVPMTASTLPPRKRSFNMQRSSRESVELEGPHANYGRACASLCQAAQAIGKH